jgi:hypothetical protein
VFRLIGWTVRPVLWALMLAGGAFTLSGGLMFLDSHIWVPPERAALSQVAGVLDSARKVVRGRARYLIYDLEIKRADGEVVELLLPAHRISDERVKNLLGQPVVALFSNTQFLWELSSGGTTIISYEQTLREDAQINALVARVAPMIGGSGILLLLTGGLWVLRRRSSAGAA